MFDASGKYLYFLASTDAGPVKDWFAQSNADMRADAHVYLAVLRKDAAVAARARRATRRRREAEKAEDEGREAETPKRGRDRDADGQDRRPPSRRSTP